MVCSRTARPTLGWISDWEEIEFCPCLGLGAADHRIEAGHDFCPVVAAAVASQSGPYVCVELPALFECGLRGEHQLGGAGGELAAGIGGAGLHQHRPALRRTRDVQRAADGEVFAPVVQRVQLVGVEEDAAVLVADESVVFPTVPQAGDDLGELHRTVVAIRVRVMLLAAVVEGLGLVVRRHQVPAGTSAADLVQRGELPRQRIGLAVGRWWRWPLGRDGGSPRRGPTAG